MSKKLFAILSIVLLTLFMGCFEKNEKSLKEIKIVGASQVQNTQQITLEAQKLYDNNEVEIGGVTWTVDANATITQEGLLTATAEGKAVVTITTGEFTETKEIEIIAYNAIGNVTAAGGLIFADNKYEVVIGYYEEEPVKPTSVSLMMDNGIAVSKNVTWTLATNDFANLAPSQTNNRKITYTTTITENDDSTTISYIVNKYEIGGVDKYKVRKVKGYNDDYTKPSTIEVTLRDEAKTIRTSTVTWSETPVKTVTGSGITTNYYEGIVANTEIKAVLAEEEVEINAINATNFNTEVLEIKLINGPVNQDLWYVGEVAKATYFDYYKALNPDMSDEDIGGLAQNPADAGVNKYTVTLDSNGNGSIYILSSFVDAALTENAWGSGPNKIAGQFVGTEGGWDNVLSGNFVIDTTNATTGTVVVDFTGTEGIAVPAKKSFLTYAKMGSTVNLPSKVDSVLLENGTIVTDAYITEIKNAGKTTSIYENTRTPFLIKWNTTETAITVDKEIETFTGTVVATDDKVTIVVKELKVDSIADFKEYYNLEDEYVLPSTVKATMNNMSTEDYPVTWEVTKVNGVAVTTTTAINTLNNSTYTLDGTVTGSTEDVELTVEPDGVASLTDNSSVEYIGKDTEEYILPGQLQVTLKSGEKIQREVVKWTPSGSAIDVKTLGTYIYKGKLANIDEEYILTINVVNFTKLRIHYQRADGLYDDWGLNNWTVGTVPASNDWDNPILFEDTSKSDAFGRYIDIEISDPTKVLGSKIHNNELGQEDTGSTAGDAPKFLIPAMNDLPGIGMKEVWITSGTYVESEGIQGNNANDVRITDNLLAVVTEMAEPTYIKVHYHRYDGNYTNWGLHLWDPAVIGTDWAAPLLFDKTDSFGTYAEVSVVDNTKTFNLIVRDVAGNKDGGDKMLNPAQELWIIEGNDTVFTSQPSLDTQAKTATLKEADGLDYVIECDLTSSVLYENTVKLLDYYSLNEETKVVTKNEINYDSFKHEDLKLYLGLDNINYDSSKNYYVEINEVVSPVQVDIELLKSTTYTYDGDDLGATLNTDGSATLKLWTPVATNVVVHVYEKDDQTIEIAATSSTSGAAIALTRGTKGVWSVTLDNTNTNLTDLEGYFYKYEVTAYGKTTWALDPYAKSMAAFGHDSGDAEGKAAIVDIDATAAGTKPVSIGNSRLANPVDMVAYEVHVRDFTIGTDVANAGTFAGFKNYQAGIDHLVALGVTHVQLLPVQNFYTVDETDKTVSASTNTDPNYNWGYDPHNYFSLEGWYSTDAENPYSRMKEFRELVQKLHDNGIGVIMDVVYNHTYQNTILNNVVPGYYYRPTGGTTPVGEPAVASERPMVRNLIKDSLKYFVDEYGVDGFRFDLMGFIDSQTMLEVRELLGNQVIIQGEAWNYTDLDPTTAPVKGVTDFNEHKISDLAYFNDTSRDAYKGGMGESQVSDDGFIQGELVDTNKAKAGIIGGLKEFDNNGVFAMVDTDDYNRFAINPNETLQFLSIHDGLTLWDKINLTVDGDEEERAKYVKQAIAMLMTSQGKIILNAGTEIARTKPATSDDPTSDRIHTTDFVEIEETGTAYFHDNSYASSDFTNKIRWDKKESEVGADLFAYTSGLIALRRAVPALRFNDAKSIQDGLTFIGEKETTVVEEEKAGFTTFGDVDEFTIKFVNAAASAREKTWYFAGELEATEDNPSSGLAYKVEIGTDGKGEIKLTSAQISTFRLSAWGATQDLNFKLVEVAGAWDAPEGSYSSTGNTRLIAANILADKTITIDLSISDYTPGQGGSTGNQFIAYKLDNTLETALGTGVISTPKLYETLIVVHNSASHSIVVDDSIIDTTWDVLVDENDAGTTPLTYTLVPLDKNETDVQIGNGKVIVPAHSSTVIAK